MAKATIASLERILTEDIKPLLSEHDKILVRGNGEPSLQEKLRNIEAYIREDRENRKYYSRLFISIALTNVAALVIASLIWFIKILPVLDSITKASKVTGL